MDVPCSFFFHVTGSSGLCFPRWMVGTGAEVVRVLADSVASFPELSVLVTSPRLCPFLGLQAP